MKRAFVLSQKKVSLGVGYGLLAATLVAGGVWRGLAQAPAGGPPPGGPPGGAPGGRGPGVPPAAPPTAGAHLEIIDGSATYRVTEQFVGVSFTNDAEGTTPTAAGSMAISPDGSIAPGGKLMFDLRNLKSDQDMRDGFVRQRTLETDKFPMAEFVPTKIEGIPVMIPTQGQVGFQLTGNMTIHGVTKPVTFQGIATFGRDSTLAGRAKTSFTFATFGLTKPSIGRLANVDDKIELEIVYKFKRS